MALLQKCNGWVLLCALWAAMAIPARAVLPLSDSGNAGNWVANPALSDEFNGTSLDTTKWLPAMPQSYWLGRTPSEYDPANVSVSNGVLDLRTINQNLLPNGNFEWGNLNSWTNVGGGAAIVAIGKDSQGLATTADFTYAAVITGSADLEQTVSVTPNTTYQLSCNMRVGTSPQVALGVRDAGGVVISSTTNTTNSWYPTLWFQFSSGSSTSVTVYCLNSGTGTGYFDEVALVPATLPTTGFALKAGRYLTAASVESLTAPVFGYYEARMQASNSTSSSSFWLQSSGTFTLKGSEIDVCELVGTPTHLTYDSKIAHEMPITTHYFPNSSVDYSNGHKIDVATPVAGAFHTYGVDWEPATITFYFDGAQVQQFTQLQPPGFPLGSGTTQVQRLQWLFFDTEVFSQYGIQEPGVASDLYVDYVRAWTHGLPAGWTDGDLGHPLMPGTAMTNGTTWTVAGSGLSTSATDQYNYVSQAADPFCSNTIVANVSISGSSEAGNAGVLIRDGTTGAPAFASVAVTSTGAVSFQWRTAEGSAISSCSVNTPGRLPGSWVKLARSGSVFTGYYSSDGNTWTAVNASQPSATVNFTNANPLIGLETQSNNIAELVTAAFTGVSVQSPPCTVTVAPSPAGSGIVSGAGSYQSGSPATVAAAPTSGYGFAAWSEYGATVSTSSSYPFTVAGSRSLVANFQPTSFATWKALHFTTAELASPAISGTLADPEQDGSPNLLKYGLGLDPKVVYPPSSHVQTAVLNGYLTLTYQRSKQAADLTYIVEVSSDLQAWHSGPADISAPAILADDGYTQTVQVADLTPYATAIRRFIRLRVVGP